MISYFVENKGLDSLVVMSSEMRQELRMDSGYLEAGRDGAAKCEEIV